MSDRCKEFFASVPLATVFLLVLILSIHACVFLFTIDVGPFTLHPYRVIYAFEYYRCISAALLHGGAMHILMNMMTLFSLGSSMERKFGSLQFFFFSMWTIVLCGVLYCLQSWFLTKVTGDMSYLRQPAVGYSGVLFAYIFIECYHTTNTSRSFFGLFSVPTKVYPWIILVVMQFVMPNISFLGHLSGILVGLMAVYGIMDLIMPSYEFYSSCEGSPYFCNIYRYSNFVLAVDCRLKISSGTESEQSVLKQAFNGMSWVVITTWHFISTILYIIGCPVDACTSAAGRWYAMSVNYVNSFTSANRNVFEVDSPGGSFASEANSHINTHPHHHPLDRLETGRGGGMVNPSSGRGVSTNSTAGTSQQSQAEMEAHRKNARDARLQKFAQGPNSSNSHASPSTRRTRDNSPKNIKGNASSRQASNDDNI